MEAESNSQREEALISSFCEIASGSKEEARFFLESHNWDLDAAVSTFLDDATIAAGDQPPIILPASRSPSPEYAPSRSRSPSPAAPSRRRTYDLRSRREKPSGSRIRTLADLNRPADDDSDSDADEPQEYYTGGEKSGMLVQDPTRGNDAESIFNQAKQSGRVVQPESVPSSSSSSRSFTGNARLLTGETVSAAPVAPQRPSAVTHTITLWRNGFTVNGGPLRRLDDPANAPFLESIKRSECPQELAPVNIRTPVHVKLEKSEDDYLEPVKPKETFQGMGRTLGGSDGGGGSATDGGASFSAPVPTMGLVVDDSLPSTSLQLRLADGTRMVSRFNHHHTIRDVRSFIDASRPDGPRSYQLQMMGFPPKVLGDLDQTIDQAGVANSVVIQKL